MFLAPNFECFNKNDAFCSHSIDYYACLRRLRHVVMKRFENAEKFYSSATLLKMAGGGRHPPHRRSEGYLPPCFFCKKKRLVLF